MHPCSGPLVSVIIPCHNAEKWLAHCVQSALQQTYSYAEIIIIDDGSSDRSVEIVKSFGSAVRWMTGPNKGPCAARNAGFQLSRGEWIQYLDADDLLHPQKLELSISVLDEFPDVDFIWAPHSTILESPAVPAAYSAFSQPNLPIQVSTSPLDAPYAPWAAMFRRTFLESVGLWNEALRRWVDLEYHARIAAQTKEYVRIGFPLYFYRQHSGERISNSNRLFSNVDGGLMSLTLAQRALENSKIPAEKWKEYLWPFYAHLARSAAESGDTVRFCNLLEQSSRLRNSAIYTAKCRAAMAASAIIGSKRVATALRRLLDH